MTSIFRWMASLCSAAALTACASAVDPLALLPACRDNCQSHTDGYEWAQRSNLSDTEACAGYPTAFVDGCRNGVEDFRMLQPKSKGI